MITRRGLLLGSAAVAGFSTLPPASLSAQALREKFLQTPNFPQLRRTAQFVAGVRPHRRTGIRLERETLISPSGTKHVVHNYGHGGAGITLSWGCAAIARDLVADIIAELGPARSHPVAILGIGVIGLTVASELRLKFPALPITIYAKTTDVRKTTSFIAGGQFEPSQIWAEYTAPAKKEILTDYIRRSAEKVRLLESSGRRHQFGIAQRSNYTLDNPQPSFDIYTPPDVVPPFRPGRLPFAKLNDDGREYRTWIVNPKFMLPTLVAELRRASVRFRARTLQTLDDVRGLAEAIVVNCTGYGAKKLFRDPLLQARRGHLVVLKNPAKLQYLFSGGCENSVISYMFARQDDIVVGGTVVRNDERETFDTSDPEDKQICLRILANIEKVFAGEPESCIQFDADSDVS